MWQNLGEFPKKSRCFSSFFGKAMIAADKTAKKAKGEKDYEEQQSAEHSPGS